MKWLAHPGLHENLKTGLCPKWAAFETNLEHIMVNPHEEKRAYENVYGIIIVYEFVLKVFG